MSSSLKNKKKFKEKLINKYRMVIINEDTFEEKISFKLSRLNVFIFGGIFSLLLIVLTTLLIALTPLREYIPGYSSVRLKKKVNELVYRTDSLTTALEVNNIYINNVKDVLIGDIKNFEFDTDSVFDIVTSELPVAPSTNDSIFREQIEREDQFSVFTEAKKDVGIVFFAPVTGTITQGYDPTIRHFSTDVAIVPGTPVKAVADGTVIFSEWTAATGHVIILEHQKGFTSIYKHNSALHKFQGDIVQSGEVIASSGSTGELSTGPHLHFELWSDGYPVNPVNFIDFE